MTSSSDEGGFGVDASHGGFGWKPRESGNRSGIGSVWSDFGASSEFGQLKRVMLYRPSIEDLSVTNAEESHWFDKVQPDVFLNQFDGLTRYYRENDIEVLLLEKLDQTPDPNQVFMRDLFVMTPEGALICRPASAVRAGQELRVQKALSEFDVPIIGSIIGDGFLEGPDIVFLKPNIALIGVGLRTNLSGARQAEQILAHQGIRSELVETTYGCGHLDGVLNIAAKELAVVFQRRISYRAVDIIKENGYQIAELPSYSEATERMAINFVPISDGTVVMPLGCDATKAMLETHGLVCDELDVSEMMKAGGAVHCVTGVVARN